MARTRIIDSRECCNKFLFQEILFHCNFHTTLSAGIASTCEHLCVACERESMVNEAAAGQ